MAGAAAGRLARTPGWRASALGAALAMLSVLAILVPGAAFGAEWTGTAALQRELSDTRDVALEVAKAVQRVERMNAARRDSLSAEARRSGAADMSAPMLRAASLDVDAVRSQVRTTEDRIKRRETEIDLLDQQLKRQAATQRADTDESPAAAVAQQGPLGELRAVSAELLEALQRLADAEAEHLVLAEERLALLQSRVELDAIRDLGGFEEDPRVGALRAIVSRQTRNGTRLANEAAAIEPESVASGMQKQLLELQANDAIARATQRLIDLDLLSIQSQIGFLDELAGNRAVPVRVLRDGRSELDVMRGRLKAQQHELTEERFALIDQRKLIGGQGGEASELVEAQLALVGNLEELLDFQQADIGTLQQQIAESAALLDAEIGGRELSALAERRPLPLGPHHRDLLGSELALLPQTILERGRGLADTVEARLASSSGSLAALIAGALAAIGIALWWLYQRGLRKLVSLDPNGLSSIPIEAFRRTLPTLLPVLAWLAVALLADLDPRSMALIAATLAFWPAVSLLLHAHDLLAAKAGRAPGADRSGHSALIGAACIGAIVLVVHAAPTLPSLGYVVDRFAFIGVALAAIGTWTLRGSLLAALRTRPHMSPAWLRFLEVVTVGVPGLLALAAVGGLAGWVDLGWAIAGGVGGVTVAIGLVLGVAYVLRTVTHPMRAQLGTRRNMVAFDAAFRLALIGLAIGTAWYLVATYTESTAVAASFWVLAIAIALPFVLQPIEALVELLLRIDRNRPEDGAVSVLAICVDRGVRALLIVGAALGLASLLDFDLATLASGDTLQAKIVRAAFNIALVAFLADFVWQLAKTMIDQRLAIEDGGAKTEPSEAGGEGGGQGASRLRTLLPLLRKFLMITLAVIVVMLVLSSLGVNIGPLLAGAGVVGLAIGFGAQTLVRDIVSGVFFLMDDAFRLGEYVDVGEVKGTVENISVRSLRLRHHRGALHTIPFGEITHLSNYSRDWVIMKLEFRVPFDTDMQQVKKIFKRIGAEMMADEELGSNLLDPPKSQGVFQMDDSAMIVRAKFMAKPGKQFVIRRELYHRAQKEFDAAGIEFARRQVSVFVPPGADPETAALAVQAAATEEPAGGKKGVQAAE